MSTIIDLRDFCRAQFDWLLDTTESLVATESPTTDKAAVDRCGDLLASHLEAIGGRGTRLPPPDRGGHLLASARGAPGARVTPLPRSDRGNHLLAEFGCGSSQVLLLGHFDTV